MIPGDLASRLRIILEASVQPAAQPHEIPAGLPRFETGQRFAALIQTPLPDGSFQALVAGKTLTLALPGSAKSGDVLELVVTAQRGSTVYARQADVAAIMPQATDSQPRPVLSQTGQLISELLTGRSGQAEPLPLSRAGTVLTTSPQNTTQTAQVLKEAVSSSGLFYESHLREWVDGKMPLAVIRQEPQAQQVPLPAPAAPVSAGTAASTQILFNMTGIAGPQEMAETQMTLQPSNHNTMGTQVPSSQQTGNPPKESASHVSSALAMPGDANFMASRPAAAGTSPDTPEASKVATRSMAEQLMPVVQQQLETLATHQMSWQGQIWPGVHMQWDIIDPEQQHGRSADDEETAQFWRSALRITLPNLGDVQAQLVLSTKGLTVHIDTDNPQAAENMRVAGPQLHDSMESAGVSLIKLQVSSHADA